MLFASSLASRFRLARRPRISIYQVARSFGGSGNSAAQEESPFKDFEYNIPQEILPCKIENPACDVIQDDWAIVRAFKYAPIVCRALYQEGYKALLTGVDSKDMYQGVRMAMAAVDKYLKRTALKIRQKKEIVQLTTTVSDRKIGELIAKGVEKVGYDGLLLVMPDKNMGNALEYDNGMQLGWSFVSPHHPHFFNDLETSTSSVENPFVLIVEHKSFNRNVVEQAIKSMNYKRPLLIVTEKADLDLVESIEGDRESLGIQVYVVEAMVNREDNNAILHDLAALTGGQVVTEVSDMNPIPSMLGSCREVRIAGRKIVVIGGSGGQESIEKRRQQLLSTIRRSELSFKAMLLKDRLVEFSRGAAIYKAGVVQTEESHKNYLRVFNSVRAVNAGIKEGIIPGGGVALLHASKELDKLQVENSGQKYGVELFQHVLKMPVYSIASTAGFDGLAIVEKILEQEDIDFGYDPAKGEYVDMIKSGNMDPYKLVSRELQNLVRNFSDETWSQSSELLKALAIEFERTQKKV
ncbi:Chaperonin CPN60-2, mitochondrial [Melia azedarach]|uniref:Chaperonin CPN60-2, mitochondrial n=1 Tax=Melia azedarach TaxID=155640 RepID=A0ACC1YZV3_MELAZ|nr:Chaperonin CPN60-2, mitochondrial [Melia azedarach]